MRLVIILIPKPEKKKSTSKGNYRPMYHECTYKIPSSILANESSNVYKGTIANKDLFQVYEAGVTFKNQST